MRIIRSRTVLACVILSTLATAGCGDSSPSLTPTAPSGTSLPAGLSGSTINGQVNRGSGLGTNAWTTSAATTGSVTVSVEGTSISATVDSQGSFTLTGLPQGTLRLQFRGSGIDAKLTVTLGSNEQVTIAVTVAGNSATIESEHRSGSTDSKVELEGRITEIDATARTLRVSGALVTVPITAMIRHGGDAMLLSALKVGDRVHVKGTRQADGVQATEVNVQSQNSQPQTGVEGVVAGLKGPCPALTFIVGETPVTTDGSTFFKGGSCKDLQNMDRVEVKGQRRADGILATQVASEGDDDENGDENDSDDGENDGMTVKGLVAGRSGTCPGPITFMIGTTKVVTDTATKFDGIACTAVLDGKRVEVKGTRKANNDLLASKVEPND